ncbi:MAG: T9SS type A sorting domain-containing protein [Bacteroidetes bacterium]|nr:T9SS type A sorting domain-containing protein [Bacteroidota bacterium]
MKQFAIFFFSSLLSFTAWAQDLHHEGDVNQNITPYNDAADAINNVSTAHLKNQVAWQQFVQNHPSWGATFNRFTKLPHRAFGNPITYTAGASDAVAKAKAFLQNEFSGFQLPINELVLTRSFNDGKYINVDFKQVHNNYEILWSRAIVRFSQDLKITLTGVDLHRNIPALAASISANDAVQKAKDAITTTITGAEVGSVMKIFPLPVDGEYDYRLVYEVRVKTNNPNGTPGDYLTYVDANSGEILYRQNQVKFFDVKVKGDVRPINQYTATENRPLKNLKVKVGTTNYYTNNLGIANVPTGPANTTLYLEGKWVEVIDEGSSAANAASYAHTFSATGDSTTFSTTIPNSNERCVNVYYHVNEIHDYMKTKLPTFTDMDNPLPANVDVAGTCNAFYNGSSINFYAAGGGCNAFSYIGDVMSHEYGHGINDKFYNWQGSSFDNGGMGEGYADVWANGILKTGIIGQGANSPTDFIRRYDLAPKVYPQDLVGQVHADGEIIAGAWWDVGQNWNSIDSAMTLFADSYFGLATGPDGTEGQVYHDILIDALQYDDDNANLNDGTPHFGFVVSAFATHGIYLLSNTILHHNPATSIVAGAPFTINAVASADYPAFIGDIKMIYRLKGTTISDTILMTKSGVNYTCQFPSATNGNVYEYIFAIYDYTNFLSLYSPVNANFNTGFTSRNIPYYMLVGYNTVYAEPFDNITSTTPNWTIGNASTDNATGGKWIVALPISSVTNGDTVQTGKDHSTGTGKCAVTGNAASASSQPGNADVDGGRTSLLTPSFDLSAYNKPVISYWRWYTNSQSSNNPGKDLWRVSASYDNGATWTIIERTYKPDVRWRRSVFVADLTKGNSVMLMFTATDSAATSSGGTWVEAAIDDIEILELGSGAAVGVQNIKSLDATIYPNPAGNEISIRTSENGKLDYTIVNTLGEVVLQKSNIELAHNSLQVNTSSLANGFYFVKLSLNGNNAVHRLQIAK